MLDLLIQNGCVISMNPDRDIIEHGAIAVEGDRIVAVGPVSQFESSVAKRVIDGTGMCIIPGLVDSHGHSGHGLTKTIAENTPGVAWLSVVENIYLRYSTEEFWHVEAQLSALERLKFGVTCGYSMLGNNPRADDPVYAMRHLEGAMKVGIRDILGIGPAVPPWPKVHARWKGDTVERYESDLDDALKTTEKVLNAHAKGNYGKTLVHVSPARVGKMPGLPLDQVVRQTDEVVRLAQEYGSVINSHASGGDIVFSHEHLNVLGPNVVLAHCNGISPEEVRILADTGTHVSHSPSARAFARARCPVPELIAAGVNVALGTDGTGPDRNYDMFKDMRAAFVVQRTHFHDTSYMPPGKVFEMATIDAARSLGLGDVIGSIEPGKYADLTLVNIEQPHLYPWTMPVHRMVYEAAGQDVDTVIVGGEVLMEGRKVLTVDERSVLRAAQREFELALSRSEAEKYTEIPPKFWGKVYY